ncbi:16S rRNA (guanine(966)-N(2))-methyltransferase RsmD [Chitinibacter sp. ZOR0017]|uniref:16S rRNA (guanine(966)-N(2))-methyltransferase RsmD n=1 Tax=Chitinibacter sp. ZOR0017 TaxID=1339254 RepID=UPI0006460C5E|nr:16S rRNA (guanine(966)-N(2))-methyltransferase RsmD [Chitinibacter sp. ZOR0017]
MSAQHKNQVRIIGGQYRRRILKFPDSLGLRPTPDRVRETLFNWLGQDLTGWHCLDLFAGSGGLGFEAASRHAKQVVMVEMARPVYQALQASQQTLGAREIQLLNADAQRFLSQNRQAFDLVFLDPPFASTLLADTLALLPPHLSERARVYIECETLPDLSGWEILREGKAGTVRYALLCRAAAGDAENSTESA